MNGPNKQENLSLTNIVAYHDKGTITAVKRL